MSASVVNAHVIRVGEACPKCPGVHRSPIFLILNLWNTILIGKEWSAAEICTGPFLGGRHSAVYECWCTHEPLLHLVFGSHKATLIPLLFLLAFFDHVRVSEIAYLK